MIVARGQRVYLRTFTPEDLAYVSEWAEDPFLEHMVGSEFLHAFKHDYDEEPAFYEGILTDPTQVVMIIMATRQWTRPLGLVRLFNIHLLEGYAFLEVMITDRGALRLGFGVDAGRLITCYGVDVLGLRRIEAKVYEYNRLSMNSLRRHGFHHEGILRKAGFQEGRYWDVHVFGILKEEIEAKRRENAADLPFAATEGDVREPT